MALVGASVSERQYKQSVSVSLSNVHSRIIACCRLRAIRRNESMKEIKFLYDFIRQQAISLIAYIVEW